MQIWADFWPKWKWENHPFTGNNFKQLVVTCLTSKKSIYFALPSYSLYFPFFFFFKRFWLDWLNLHVGPLLYRSMESIRAQLSHQSPFCQKELVLFSNFLRGKNALYLTTIVFLINTSITGSSTYWNSQHAFGECQTLTHGQYIQIQFGT